MEIEVQDFVAGARQARGLAVIIDVFRAFSLACYGFHQGAAKIIAVTESDAAFALKSQWPQAKLIGERGGKKLTGVDFGNSPSEILEQDIRDKTLIHTTHAGTQGLVNAVQADEVITGAFVNAKAIVRYIHQQQPPHVTLVRMGWQGETRTDEDDLCTEYLHTLLRGQDFDEGAIYQRLRQSPCAERFFDAAQPWNPESDFDLCLALNVFDFVLKARPLATTHVELACLKV